LSASSGFGRVLKITASKKPQAVKAARNIDIK